MSGLSRCDPDGLEAISSEWDRLAEGCDSPFLTSAWYTNWLRCFAPDDGVALVLRAEDGAMLAGGCFVEGRRGVIANAVNEHSNNGGVVARDEAAKRRFWEEIAALGRPRVNLDLLIDGEEPASTPAAALSAAGYRTVEVTMEPSPWMELPDSLEDLLAERSRNFRSQVGRKRRRLEKEGELTLRVNHGDERLEGDLETFFALEAAGWKGERGTGTAIAGDDSLLAFYRGFAKAAAERGWLRLYLLELDGRVIAADYGCVYGDCGYLIKTAFDEGVGRFAPGFVLRADVLRASIEEGLRRYDFLGGPDDYKTRWADRLRDRRSLYGFSGAGTIPAYAWRKSLRPALKGVRDRIRARRGAERRG